MKRPTQWALFCLLEAVLAIPMVALCAYVDCSWGVHIYAVAGLLWFAVGMASWSWTPPQWMQVIALGPLDWMVRK